MSRLLGWLIVISVFVGLFVMVGVQKGFGVAVFAFSIAAVLTVVLGFASYLIVKDS